MIYCTRCGDYVIVKTQKHVRHVATTRGGFFDIEDGVCDNCLRPFERVEDGAVVDGRN